MPAKKKMPPGGPLKIATWNINSVRIRLDAVSRLINAHDPDVICLQEIKTENATFPSAFFVERGYAHASVMGQKMYNGVAILSKLPLAGEGRVDWCGKGDMRHQMVHLPGDIELHNFYVPAGGDVPDRKINDKFGHKLDFLEEMTAYFAKRRKSSSRMVLVGDLNIAPHENDVWSHKQLLKVVSHTPVEVEAMAKLQAAHDWVDAVRHFVPESEKIYSWWSYRAPDWDKADKGRRLDHIWVTPALKGALKKIAIMREARGFEQASDHAPVIVTLNL